MVKNKYLEKTKKYVKEKNHREFSNKQNKVSEQTPIIARTNLS
jgi:hypothetical protein